VTSNLSILILEVFSIFLVLLKKSQNFGVLTKYYLWTSVSSDFSNRKEEKVRKAVRITCASANPTKNRLRSQPPAAPLLKYLLSLIPLTLYPLAW
jgi:hypothetical protein